MHDGMTVAGGDRFGQGGFPGAVAAIQEYEVVLAHPLGAVGTRHARPIRAASSSVVVKRPLTAYWIMRFRQFGSRPSANVHHRLG